MKDIGSTLENTSALYVGNKSFNLLIKARSLILIKTLTSFQIQKVKVAINLLRKKIQILSKSIFIANNWDMLSKIVELEQLLKEELNKLILL